MSACEMIIRVHNVVDSLGTEVCSKFSFHNFTDDRFVFVRLLFHSTVGSVCRSSGGTGLYLQSEYIQENYNRHCITLYNVWYQLFQTENSRFSKSNFPNYGIIVVC